MSGGLASAARPTSAGICTRITHERGQMTSATGFSRGGNGLFCPCVYVRGGGIQSGGNGVFCPCLCDIEWELEPGTPLTSNAAPSCIDALCSSTRAEAATWCMHTSGSSGHISTYAGPHMHIAHIPAWRLGPAAVSRDHGYIQHTMAACMVASAPCSGHAGAITQCHAWLLLLSMLGPCAHATETH